jgi:hypothetical protein
MNISNQPLLLSLDDFIDLLQNGNWTHEQSIDEKHMEYKKKKNPYYDPYSNDPKEREEFITYFWGYAGIKSTLQLGEGQIIEITYQEVFSYDEDDPDETWETTTDMPNCGWDWYMKGIEIIDDDGDEVESRALHTAIENHAGEEFWEIDYSEIEY